MLITDGCVWAANDRELVITQAAELCQCGRVRCRPSWRHGPTGAFDVQRLYRTLSELKGEVEGAIRSGRAAAAARGAGGAVLAARVDALKELYNRLGARVTDAKGRLEGALVAARDLHADLQALAGWLAAQGAPPSRQALELDMSRMEGVRARLNAAFARLENAPGPLRAQVALVNARWERLRRPQPEVRFSLAGTSTVPPK